MKHSMGSSSLVLTAILLAPQSLTADDSASEAPSALIQKALVSERDGDVEMRRRLLTQAIAEDAALPHAHWQLGFVQSAGEWLTPPQAAERTATGPAWQRYLHQRQKTKPTVEGQWQLAQWCKARQLPELARGHLLVADRIAPDPKIHRALGRTLREGKWLTDAEFDRARSEQQQWVQAYEQYKPIMLKLARQSRSNDAAEQAVAIEAILAMRDPRAVAAMENVLSVDSEKLALVVVEVLPQITHWVATVSLVRHAVWAPWETVRTAAINQLVWQDSEQVLPLLISLMRPADSGARQVGRLHIWFWQDLTTTYVDIEGPFGTGESVIQPTGRWGLSREDRVRRDFATTDEANRLRVTNAHSALRRITGQNLGTDASDWHEWWTEATGMPIEEDAIRTTVVRFSAREPFFSPAAVCSCFAAGTPVWTMRGLVAIDKVELGDMVLSQDVTTGELAYRPVIRRTLRPRTEFRTVHVGEDAVRTTAIHPFWVTGKGWMKVKDMTEAPMLRAYDGPKPATVTDGEPELAYNLEVADFHTYFVGKTGLLVHDVSPITTRGITVPGLVETN